MKYLVLGLLHTYECKFNKLFHFKVRSNSKDFRKNNMISGARWIDSLKFKADIA